MRSVKTWLVLAIFLAGSLSVVAQQPPNLENGFKHWGTYDGGSLDTVNNLNGNQMLHAPLLPNYAQRGGLSVQDFLYMTSKGWQITCKVDQPGGPAMPVDISGARGQCGTDARTGAAADHRQIRQWHRLGGLFRIPLSPHR